MNSERLMELDRLLSKYATYLHREGKVKHMAALNFVVEDLSDNIREELIIESREIGRTNKLIFDLSKSIDEENELKRAKGETV